ncbi:hypothetical protein [Enterococcus sp. LJL51]|uniref:hypothetical protein n=1 Tax=Enterococcus sp. LJL51 TaxID=3416656 RepID=UPI003CEC550A
MSVPKGWKWIGWLLCIGSVIQLYQLIQVFEIAMYVSDLLIYLVIVLSFNVVNGLTGIFLIRGSIIGYHLTKVLIILTLVFPVLELLTFGKAEILSVLVRLFILSRIVSKNSDLYLTHLRLEKSERNKQKLADVE